MIEFETMDLRKERFHERPEPPYEAAVAETSSASAAKSSKLLAMQNNKNYILQK